MLEQFAIWTVYENPSDYPGLFVARMWIVTRQPEPVPTDVVFTGPTLLSVRGKIPAGLHCIPRQPLDDVTIVETWF